VFRVAVFFQKKTALKPVPSLRRENYHIIFIIKLSHCQIMWWKALSIVLITYTLLAGLLVPLKSGLLRAEPGYAKTGQTATVRMYGYNSFFARPSEEPFRVWLSYDDQYAVLARSVTAISDTLLEATFALPAALPKNETSVLLNIIADHPVMGTAILPSGLEVRRDTTVRDSLGVAAWTQHPVGNLHVQSGFSFPYQNVIYESIRNTYYHVPMWFVLMFLCCGSVIFSIRYLIRPNPHTDRQAIACTEMGLLFGMLGLLTGMVWANYTWGEPWSNDIKQICTAVALLVYVAYFILRNSFDEPEKGARLAAVYNVFAFASLIPLLYVVPRLFASLHPGATGNPAFGSQDLDNTMRMVFYPAIIGWTLLGFWVAQLRARYLRVRDHAMGLD
jgi:heme exporter protein C